MLKTAKIDTLGLFRTPPVCFSNFHWGASQLSWGGGRTPLTNPALFSIHKTHVQQGENGDQHEL